MSEQGRSERVLIEGETASSVEQRIQTVRAALKTHVRTSKGLPFEPLQLEVDLLSQLSDAKVVDSEPVIAEVKTTTVSIQTLTHKDSALALAALKKRTQSKKAA